MANFQECNKCKSNEFPNQQIGFIPDINDQGKQKTNSFTGKPAWILINPDQTVHKHKEKAPNTDSTAQTTITYASNKATGTSANGKEDYWTRKEEKYDKNVEEYK